MSDTKADKKREGRFEDACGSDYGEEEGGGGGGGSSGPGRRGYRGASLDESIESDYYNFSCLHSEFHNFMNAPPLQKLNIKPESITDSCA